MARNRNRNYRKQVRTRLLPGWLAALVVVLAGLGFSYLWVDAQCDELGHRIKKLEQEKIAVRRLVVNEEYKWSNLTTYENINSLLKKHDLQMDWPKQADIVRVRRPAASLALTDGASGTPYAQN